MTFGAALFSGKREFREKPPSETATPYSKVQMNFFPVFSVFRDRSGRNSAFAASIQCRQAAANLTEIRTVKTTVYLMAICAGIVHINRGRDSSDGMATRYGLDGPGIKSRWEARFSPPVQAGPGVHAASYTMVTDSLSRGGKAAGAW